MSCPWTCKVICAKQRELNTLPSVRHRICNKLIKLSNISRGKAGRVTRDGSLTALSCSSEGSGNCQGSTSVHMYASVEQSTGQQRVGYMVCSESRQLKKLKESIEIG